jgi:Flp pilus assembly protein TadB
MRGAVDASLRDRVSSRNASATVGRTSIAAHELCCSFVYRPRSTRRLVAVCASRGSRRARTRRERRARANAFAWQHNTLAVAGRCVNHCGRCRRSLRCPTPGADLLTGNVVCVCVCVCVCCVVLCCVVLCYVVLCCVVLCCVVLCCVVFCALCVCLRANKCWRFLRASFALIVVSLVHKVFG